MKPPRKVFKFMLGGLILAVLLAALGLLAAPALAETFNGESIHWWAISGGSGKARNGGVTLDSTFGQPITGVSTRGSSWVGAGYWYAEQPVNVFLPVARR